MKSKVVTHHLTGSPGDFYLGHITAHLHGTNPIPYAYTVKGTFNADSDEDVEHAPPILCVDFGPEMSEQALLAILIDRFESMPGHKALPQIIEQLKAAIVAISLPKPESQEGVVAAS